MTVQDLINELKKYPGNLPVQFDGGDFHGNWLRISEVEYVSESTLGQHVGVYLS